MWTMEHIEIDISVLDELGNIKSIPDRFCGLWTKIGSNYLIFVHFFNLVTYLIN